jgi:ribonuclease HII
MVTIGIDEVGRGSWAGPLVAAAVSLKGPVEGLKDSKKLSRLQRQKLLKKIEKKALAIGIGWVSPQEIDEKGLTTAVRLAMERALAQVNIIYDQIIIDGNINFLKTNPKATALIKADAKLPAVSAASIIAKVTRDNYMTSIASDYPDYNFERHVGYGTALHLEKLKVHGICALHRRSFQPIRGLSR